MTQDEGTFLLSYQRWNKTIAATIEIQRMFGTSV
jgi:hypothetical protein